jgi:hypothetical protein
LAATAGTPLGIVGRRKQRGFPAMSDGAL